MKCPDCGAEIVEDHLYCDKCGREIQMVPDFEPEIEKSITETLSTVAEEIEEKEPEKKPEKEQEKKPAKKRRDALFPEEQGKNWLLISLVTFIVVTVAAVLVSLHLYHRYSLDYQIQQARRHAQSREYEQAIAYLERAKSLRSNQAEILFLESSYYYQMGEGQRAVEALTPLLTQEAVDYEDREKAYGNVIAIWDEEGKYQEINDLLSECQDSEILNQFQQYTARTPEFGYVSGSYDEVLLLKISANTTGTIYYTLDGSNPTKNSPVYKSPLMLESGEYHVAALFINDYGIESEVARSWYKINLTEPEPPQVLLYSGTYHVPVEIEVEIPETGTVYYTMDGSNPTADSAKYTGAIPMPLGRTNFKFITISEEGVSSEIVSRSYDLSLETNITVNKAIENVVQALFERRVLKDLQGHSHEIVGKYVFKYNTIVEIPNLGYYYILNEYIDNGEGMQTKTDRLYAVEVYTGAPNRLIYDENGEMGLISLQQPK